MRSVVSQGPWTVKMADIFKVSGAWRALDRIDIALLCGLTAGPWHICIVDQLWHSWFSVA